VSAGVLCRIDLVHRGFSTSNWSPERPTQGRLLPVGSFAGLSFAFHGSERSAPICRQRRTVLTLAQVFSVLRECRSRFQPGTPGVQSL
jgi:hypothetical protein